MPFSRSVLASGIVLLYTSSTVFSFAVGIVSFGLVVRFSLWFTDLVLLWLGLA